MFDVCEGNSVNGCRCLDCNCAMAPQPAWSGGYPFVDDDDCELSTCAGFPSLDDAEQPQGGLVSFGYLLSGFRAVGLLPRELAAIHTFLSAHIGHRMQSPLAVGVNNRPSASRESFAGVPRWRRPTAPRFIGTTCEWQVYLIGCPRDPGALDSKACHYILPMREMVLTPANVDCYLERVVANLDASLRGFHPFRRNFLRILADFLRKHRTHEPRVVVSDAQSG